MRFDALAIPMRELPDLVEANKRCREEKGFVRLSGCGESQKTHMFYTLGDDFQCKIIVFSDARRAYTAYEEMCSLSEGVYFYDARDLLFYHADTKGRELEMRRMQTVKAIARGNARFIVTWTDALIDSVATLSCIAKGIYTIRPDDRLDLPTLCETLVAMGYERTWQVSDHGQFCVRGGIIDLYPIAESEPVRIELWDDEIDSMRSFDVESQRSAEPVEEVTVMPMASWQDAQSEKCLFLDYFSPDRTILFVDEPSMLADEVQKRIDELEVSSKRRAEAHVEMELARQVYDMSRLVRSMNRFSGFVFTMLDTPCAGLTIRDTILLEAQGTFSYRGDFKLLTKELRRLTGEGYRIMMLSPSVTRAKRIAADLREYGIEADFSDDGEEPRTGRVIVSRGMMKSGYEYPYLKWMLLSEGDVFGRVSHKKKPKYFEGKGIGSFSMLNVGDCVVHVEHGLGIYEGIERIETEGVGRDYMKLRYADDGILYVPATQLSSVQKYTGSQEKQVKLNKLGTPAWIKTKQSVQKAVWKIAEDLVALYARRREQSGHVYRADTVWQQEFEELFPFEETQDQLRAIEETKKDMESEKVMDRLICGDVGYGKTEIAIRAAFKAVQEGKQVAYLAPTTILAQQHYNTFVQRMKDFPVFVDLLCRFRSPKQQKQTIVSLRKGTSDIVIGTHRLLSKDVSFQDLGLLIIDEEQRFGVRHKEKIKQLKENVDVLTLTATPIPRTLHMSLIGIRDMSVLEEAPQNRLPIQTYVLEYNPELVREALVRELDRGGQIYYVYNRVTDIADMAVKIAKLVPEASVAFAHGQMNEHELEKTMYAFMNHEIDVLVCTTIIETGLDIGNANTMIIHDADRLGLSQLYQLRGRVGRQGRVAYAYMMYRRNGMLKEDAQKRLSAIREFTQLGSGFKIAMRDLEIRGAGNVLGEAQHGHMAAVGYDLYCQMLHDAVRKLKGEEKDIDTFDTVVDLNVNAVIPEQYIKHDRNRLEIYKRIAGARSENEIEELTEELIDRFGDPPARVVCLLQVASLRVRAHECFVTELTVKNDELILCFYEKARLDREAVVRMLTRRRDFSITNVPRSKLVCRVNYGGRRVPADQRLSFYRSVLDEVLTCVM